MVPLPQASSDKQLCGSPTEVNPSSPVTLRPQQTQPGPSPRWGFTWPSSRLSPQLNLLLPPLIPSL